MAESTVNSTNKCNSPSMLPCISNPTVPNDIALAILAGIDTLLSQISNNAEALLILDGVLQKKSQQAVLFIDEVQEIEKIALNQGIEGAIRHVAKKTDPYIWAEPLVRSCQNKVVWIPNSNSFCMLLAAWNNNILIKA